MLRMAGKAPMPITLIQFSFRETSDEFKDGPR